MTRAYYNEIDRKKAAALRELMADGCPERVGVIHCAGDAIVPQLAARFIIATKGRTYAQAGI